MREIYVIKLFINECTQATILLVTRAAVLKRAIVDPDQHVGKEFVVVVHALAEGSEGTATEKRSDCYYASFLTDNGNLKFDLRILAFHQPQLISYFSSVFAMVVASVFLPIISHVGPPLAAFYLLDIDLARLIPPGIHHMISASTFSAIYWW